LPFDRVGQADPAGFRDLIAVFLHQHVAEDRFAVSAAHHAVRFDAFEHVTEHLREKHGFKFLGDFANAFPVLVVGLLGVLDVRALGESVARGGPQVD